MRPIKISIFGADGLTCQIPRIKEAMQSLGHILSNNSPDLIYSNDPTGYEKATLLKKNFQKQSKNLLLYANFPQDSLRVHFLGNFHLWKG